MCRISGFVLLSVLAEAGVACLGFVGPFFRACWCIQLFGMRDGVGCVLGRPARECHVFRFLQDDILCFMHACIWAVHCIVEVR